MKTQLCFENKEIMRSFPIRLEQTGIESFTVTYGRQITKQLDYNQAALELGACLMHALACEGKLETR